MKSSRRGSTGFSGFCFIEVFCFLGFSGGAVKVKGIGEGEGDDEGEV